jgi:polar amino acid transport system substrate-binding protein
MARGKRRVFATVALIVLAGVVAAAAAACSGSGAGSAAGSGAQTPAQIARQVLGHAPTGLAATIVSRGTLIVADDADYAPQSSVDPRTKKLVGFDVDVAKATAAILGLDVQFKSANWETVPSGLRKDRYDVSIGSMPVTEAGKKSVSFTAPYYYTPGQVFQKAGGAQITGVADLTGKTVGVGADSVYYTFLKTKSKAIVKTYDTDLDALPDLLDGTIQYWMTDSATGRQAVLAGKAIETTGAPLSYRDLAFATRLGEPDLIALFDHAIQKMHADGQLSSLSKHWFDGLDLSVRQ